MSLIIMKRYTLQQSIQIIEIYHKMVRRSMDLHRNLVVLHWTTHTFNKTALRTRQATKSLIVFGKSFLSAFSLEKAITVASYSNLRFKELILIILKWICINDQIDITYNNSLLWFSYSKLMPHHGLHFNLYFSAMQ